jgi:hypothetical protein
MAHSRITGVFSMDFFLNIGVLDNREPAPAAAYTAGAAANVAPAPANVPMNSLLFISSSPCK